MMPTARRSNRAVSRSFDSHRRRSSGFNFCRRHSNPNRLAARSSRDPGAEARLGEIDDIEPVLRNYFKEFHSIREPGTVDGGDVCEAGEHFFIGISRRTNEEGAINSLACSTSLGYSSSLIDIRGLSNILHLKSGLAYLGGKRLGSD